jgi:hypothetical protein
MTTAACPVTAHSEAYPRFVGDPVDVVTGAMTDETADFRLDGPLPLVFRRAYSSARASVDRGLGWGHRHGFDEELVFDLDGMRFVDFRGGEETFPFLFRDGESRASRGYVLTRVNDALYTIARRGEPTREFRIERGKLRHPLSSVADASGRIALTHDRAGRLVAIQSGRARNMDYVSSSLSRAARRWSVSCGRGERPHRGMLKLKRQA